MSEFVPVRVRVIRRETPKAFQVIYHNNTIGWLPRAVVQGGSDRHGGERNCVLPVASWFAAQEGIGERGLERVGEKQPEDEG